MSNSTKLINMSHIVDKLKNQYGGDQWPLPYPRANQYKEREQYEKSHTSISKILQYKRYE